MNHRSPGRIINGMEYLALARKKAEENKHPILYSWKVGSETWIRSVTAVVREQTRQELRKVFMLLSLFAFGLGVSFIAGSRDAALLLTVTLLIYGLVTWIIYLRCRTGILFPQERIFFLTEHGFFNGYEYISRVGSFDIDVREKTIRLQGSVFVRTSYFGSGYWKEKDMFLMWERTEDEAGITKRVRQLRLWRPDRHL